MERSLVEMLLVDRLGKQWNLVPLSIRSNLFGEMIKEVEVRQAVCDRPMLNTSWRSNHLSDLETWMCLFALPFYLGLIMVSIQLPVIPIRFGLDDGLDSPCRRFHASGLTTVHSLGSGETYSVFVSCMELGNWP